MPSPLAAVADSEVAAEAEPEPIATQPSEPECQPTRLAAAAAREPVEALVVKLVALARRAEAREAAGAEAEALELQEERERPLLAVAADKEAAVDSEAAEVDSALGDREFCPEPMLCGSRWARTSMRRPSA